MLKKYLLCISLLSSSVAVFATEKKVQETTKKSQQEVIEVTDNNFESIVLKAEKPVIVDFGAEWCGPCKAIKPTFAQLAKEHGDNYLFVTIDIDEAKETATKYNIAQVPTFIIIKDGVTKGIYVGGIKPENFTTEVKKALDADSEKGPISNAPVIPQEMLFLQAISQGNKQQMKDLLDKGFDINYIFKMPVNVLGKSVEVEFTPIALALTTCDKEISTFLLENGADLDKKFKCQNGSMITGRELVQYNMDEAVKKGKEMLTFLDKYAAMKSKTA